MKWKKELREQGQAKQAKAVEHSDVHNVHTMHELPINTLPDVLKRYHVDVTCFVFGCHNCYCASSFQSRLYRFVGRYVCFRWKRINTREEPGYMNCFAWGTSCLTKDACLGPADVTGSASQVAGWCLWVQLLFSFSFLFVLVSLVVCVVIPARVSVAAPSGGQRWALGWPSPRTASSCSGTTVWLLMVVQWLQQLAPATFFPCRGIVNVRTCGTRTFSVVIFVFLLYLIYRSGLIVRQRHWCQYPESIGEKDVTVMPSLVWCHHTDTVRERRWC